MEEEMMLSSRRQKNDVGSPEFNEENKTIVLALFAPRSQMKTKLENKNNNPIKRQRFGAASTVVLVYKISDLSCFDFPLKNDVGFKLSGCAVISKGIVVIEGGINYVKRYMKFLMKQKMNCGSSMKVIWQGRVSKPIFGKFSILHCSTEFTARKFFADHGASHYWDLAVNHDTSNS